MILRELIDIIESVAPLSYQESWDNSGLQVGDTGADIQAALLTTDVTESVVAEAVSTGCNLIVSHHPLLFHGIRSVVGATPQERCVAEAIRHGIAIYSSHTAMDCYLYGVSGRMMQTLGISDYRILVPGEGSPANQAESPISHAEGLSQMQPCGGKNCLSVWVRSALFPNHSRTKTSFALFATVSRPRMSAIPTVRTPRCSVLPSAGVQEPSS